MAKGAIRRSLGADGCFHAFDNERVSGGGTKTNKKIECMKDAEVCRTCTREKCSGSAKCVARRKRELEAEKAIKEAEDHK